MKNRIKMYPVGHSDQEYRSDCGLQMKREYGKTPNGNALDGRWVLRDERGVMLGFDRYRHDLAEQFNLDLRTTR